MLHRTVVVGSKQEQTRELDVWVFIYRKIQSYFELGTYAHDLKGLPSMSVARLKRAIIIVCLGRVFKHQSNA